MGLQEDQTFVYLIWECHTTLNFRKCFQTLKFPSSVKGNRRIFLIHLVFQIDLKQWSHVLFLTFGIILLKQFLDSRLMKYFDGFSTSSIHFSFDLIH